MDVGNLEEFHEKQVILYNSPKRKNKIKIFVPIGSRAFWKITYEDGRPIEGLSEGSFLSRKAAFMAVDVWERTVKKSETQKQFELFGDKEPPTLKRKKQSAPRA